jgi:hypothetical protein
MRDGGVYAMTKLTMYASCWLTVNRRAVDASQVLGRANITCCGSQAAEARARNASLVNPGWPPYGASLVVGNYGIERIFASCASDQ